MYRKEEIRDIAGGISLLPPGDLITDDHSLEFSNLRVDDVGAIRSRLGHSSIASGYGEVRSIALHNGTRYISGDTSLFRAGSSIATGFDGNPIGMASWRGYLLATNKSNPSGHTSNVKDNASAVSRWIPAAPVAAPTVVKGAELTTSITTFDNSETWTGSTGVTLSFDAADKQEGTHSLKAVFTEAGLYTATRTVSLNLNSVGGQTGADEDVIRIWVKVDDWKQINDIDVLIDATSSAGTFVDYYIATIPRKKLKKAKGSWTLFEIRRTQSAVQVLDTNPEIIDRLRDVVNTDLIGREARSFSEATIAAQTSITKEALTFEKFGSDDTRTWGTVTAVRLQIDSRGSTTVRFDAASIYGSVAGPIEGKAIQYYYTYVTADGIESNPSPVSTAQKFKRRSASVTFVASTEAQVTGINLYRTGGTLGAVYLQNSTPYANAVGPAIDTASDDDIGDIHTFLETDHDDPPNAAGIVAPFFGRAILFDSTSYPGRFWWTEINQLHVPGAADAIGNWNNAGSVNDRIVAASHRQGIIWFYKSKEVWRLVGDPGDSDGDVDLTRAKRGIAGPRAFCQAEGGDYVADSQGIYFFNGDTSEDISQQIQPMFRGETVTIGPSITILPVSTANLSKAALEYFNGKVYFSYPQSGSSTNDKTLVYHPGTGRWGRDDRGFSALLNEGAGSFTGGTPGGALLTLETGTADLGSAIAIIYQSKYFDFGASDALKTIEDFEIELDSASTVTITAYLNNGSTTVSLGTTTTSGREKKRFQFNGGLGQQFYNISIRITASSSLATLRFYKFYFHMYPEARVAKSFDTDEQDLGYAGVKQVRAFRVDTDNPATSTLKLLSDLPGAAMALRESPTIPLTTTRVVVEQMLSAIYVGRLFRTVIDDGSSTFGLYGAALEMRPIGEYVIAGKLFDTTEMSFGNGFVKEARLLKLEMENAAAVTIRIYSDLAGGVLALRDTLTVPLQASPARRFVILPFTADATYRGRLFKVTVTSASDFILYSGSLETRVIGTYISGGSSELYSSGDLDFGTERVKLLKEVELDVESVANIAWVASSDLPGGAILPRTSLTILPTTTRKTVKLRFPGHFKGRLHRHVAECSADWILYGARCFIKAIGSPGATPWAWAELPFTATREGIWGWSPLPISPTGENDWRWVPFEMDQIV